MTHKKSCFSYFRTIERFTWLTGSAAIVFFAQSIQVQAQTESQVRWSVGNRTLPTIEGALPPQTVAVTEKSFEDATVRAEVACSDRCNFGILLNAAPEENGWSGLYAEVVPSGIRLGTASVSEAGIVSNFNPIERQGSGFGRTMAQNMPRGGGAQTARPQSASPSGSAGTSVRSTESVAPAAPPPRPAITPVKGINKVEVIVDGDVFSAVLNGHRLPTFLVPLAEGRTFGPIALVIGNERQKFNFVTVEDGIVHRLDASRTEQPFVEQRLTSQYIAEAITYADFNNDGVLDISAGPYWYEGPEFTAAHEVYLAPPLGPMEVSTSYHAVAADFTGDGYVDLVQAGPPGMPAAFYINPGPQSRRWQKHTAFTGLSTETLIGEDLDGDGQTELIFGQGRRLVVASPDPDDPTKPWRIHHISAPGWTMPSHGVGVGDIDGDKRRDIMVSNGWWKQPDDGVGGTWTFNPVQFGDVSDGDTAGGTAQMFAYDVDGDGLNDVVTSLAPHGWGIGWFRQARDASGRITFTRHEIMGDDWPPITGPVFSQPHALAIGDIDGDGLTDIVSGKRWWAHRDGLRDPDGRGQPVVYWFRLVRDASRPRFEPHLINNDSGVGTAIAVSDLNGDGRAEVMTSNRKGAFLFRNHP